MAKHKKNPLIVALNDGRDFTWTIPDGGNLASMRKAVKHGQILTMSPVTETTKLQVGDIVLVTWHQSTIFHIVGKIQEDKFLIINSLGKENGWVEREAIRGKITKIIEPEPRPSVPALMKRLKVAYIDFIEQTQSTPEDTHRLLQIVDDLQWYADRIGEQQWDTMPRDNLWSFHQNLWSLVKQAKNASEGKAINTFTLIDHGKRCVGLASDITSIFEKKEINRK